MDKISDMQDIQQVSNYDKQSEDARGIFLTLDQEHIIQKLDLPHDADFLYLQMLDEAFRISRKTGEVEKTLAADAANAKAVWEREKTFETVMTLYDLLGYSKEHRCLSGEWCPVNALQVVGGPGTDSLYSSYAEFYSGKVDALNEACRKIGGQKLAVPASADANYQVQVFPFFPAVFQFWDGDEEFPPKVSVLWDRNALSYLHFETIYYAQHHILKRLKLFMETR